MNCPPQKTQGTLCGVPHLDSAFWISSYFFLLVFFAAFLVAFFVAMDLFSLPCVMEYCNDNLLQLVACIESFKNEVK